MNQYVTGAMIKRLREEKKITQQQISHFNNKESELISGSLGLLDFTYSPDADSQEEADFRRLIQQKPKKKRTRGFKL